MRRGERPPVEPSTDPWIELGRVVARHGVRGELRVFLHNPDSRALADGTAVQVIRADGSREERRVLSTRRHKRVTLVRMEGIATAAEADALIGSTVAVPRTELPELESGAVYHADLIGCVVQTTDGERLGTVHELIVTGSNDVCVVRDERREVLIPLVADVIATLDPTARVIIVRRLPGLLEA